MLLSGLIRPQLHLNACLLLQKRLLNSMLGDQGDGFEAKYEESKDGAEATISRCLYHTIMQQEGKPHLLRVCCCSQDAAWCARMLLMRCLAALSKTMPTMFRRVGSLQCLTSAALQV